MIKPTLPQTYSFTCSPYFGFVVPLFHSLPKYKPVSDPRLLLLPLLPIHGQVLFSAYLSLSTPVSAHLVLGSFPLFCFGLSASPTQITAKAPLPISLPLIWPPPSLYVTVFLHVAISNFSHLYMMMSFPSSFASQRGSKHLGTNTWPYEVFHVWSCFLPS